MLLFSVYFHISSLSTGGGQKKTCQPSHQQLFHLSLSDIECWYPASRSTASWKSPPAFLKSVAGKFTFPLLLLPWPFLQGQEQWVSNDHPLQASSSHSQMVYFLSLRLCFQEMMPPTLLPAPCIPPFLLPPPPPLPAQGDRLQVTAMQTGQQIWACMIHAPVGQYSEPN